MAVRAHGFSKLLKDFKPRGLSLLIFFELLAVIVFSFLVHRGSFVATTAGAIPSISSKPN